MSCPFFAPAKSYDMNTDQHVELFIYSRMVEHAVLTLRGGRAPITGPRPVAAPTERQLLAVRVASALFRTLVGGGEAPRVYGLFSLKLVRIKSLPRDPLWTAEVDKHGWSRSGTSPQGIKRAGQQGTEHERHETDSVFFKKPTNCCANIK